MPVKEKNDLTPAQRASRAQARAKTKLVKKYWNEYRELYLKEAKKLGVNTQE
jgi:hypothetical protein